MPSSLGLLPMILVLPAIWLVLLPLLDAVSSLVVSAISSFAILTILFLTAKKMQIRNQTVELSTATFGLNEVASVTVLDKYESRKKIGPDADARALLHYSAAAKYSVLVQFRADTKWPYCLISTNKPQLLAKAIETIH